MIFPYLDDCLIKGLIDADTLHLISIIRCTFDLLGLNEQKSMLLPTKTLEFIGAHLDSTMARVYVPLQWFKVIQDLVFTLTNSPRAPVLTCLQLMGHMAATTCGCSCEASFLLSSTLAVLCSHSSEEGCTLASIPTYQHYNVSKVVDQSKQLTCRSLIPSGSTYHTVYCRHLPHQMWRLCGRHVHPRSMDDQGIYFAYQSVGTQGSCKCMKAFSATHPRNHSEDTYPQCLHNVL